MFVESLEQRIAPAVLINAGGEGANPAPESVNYTDATSPGGPTPFDLASAFPDADISTLFAGSTDHYYLELNAKDTLNLWNTVSGYSAFVSVGSGTVYAFFYDVNGDKIVQSGEMTGLLISGGSAVTVNGSVYGDILTTVNGKTGDVSLNLGDLGQSIKSIDVQGSVGGVIDGNTVTGSILAGGAISKVTVGQVTTIGTGTAGNGYNFDIGGGTVYGKGVLTDVTPTAKKAGPNISNVQAGSVTSIIAGDGGESANGGSISKVTLLNDPNGFLIQSGNGGSGLSGNNKGGAGGKISDVVVYGVSDSTAGDAINIVSGNGGNGFGTGIGGAGGAVEKVYVGYEYNSGKLQKSNQFVLDYVTVSGGDGGTGKSGGNGGNLKTINLRVAPNGLVDPAILVEGGTGGDANNATGKGGNGGSVDSYYILNNYSGGEFGNLLDPLSSVQVVGGNGGGNGATGGNGGSVTNGIVLSKSIEISGGDGGAGSKKAGNGGALTSLQIAYPGDAVLTQFGQAESDVGDIVAEAVALRAGAGGNSAAGAGGNGGNLSKVNAPDTDLSFFLVNPNSGGNGGTGVTAGGHGGSVNDIHFDFDRFTTSSVTAELRTGDGGNATNKGGNGGAFTSSSFFLSNANITVTTGNGGNGTTAGHGGSISSLSLSALFDVMGTPGVITLTTGSGGGATGSGKGGNGGSITSLSAQAWGDVIVTAGDGGATDAGTSGNGGSIKSSSVAAGDPAFEYVTIWTRTFDPNVDPEVDDPYGPYLVTTPPVPPTTGSAFMAAGNGGGGVSPKKGGVGGSITGSNVSGLLDVALAAGNGTFGGNGGDIKSSGALGASFDVVDIFRTRNIDTNEIFDVQTYVDPVQGAFGAVWVTAGAGGNSPVKGGNGGSLVDVAGFSSFLTEVSVYNAGAGGSGGTGNGGNGGSISKLTIKDGGGELSVVAGAGGNSAGAGAGGNGGNVTEFSTDVDVFVRSVAAGNGGDSATGKKGGNGGSVTKVNVLDDIGERYGSNYGFGILPGSMGGIFAGAAGEGLGAGGKAGKAGSVIDVTASAIASIVAGTDAMPELVAKVDNITLRSNTTLAPNANGSFNVAGGTYDPFSNTSTNLNVASFIGGFSGNPTLADADQFKVNGGGPLTDPVTVWQPGWTPLDGLVAAQVKGNKVPALNAWLTNNDSGQLVLVSRFNS